MNTDVISRETIEKSLKEHTHFSASLQKVILLKGDASTRSYARLTLVNGTSLVAMILGNPEKAIVPEEFVEAQASFSELPFINIHRYLQRAGVRVPEIYGYDRKKGILYLEDFGDQLLEGVVHRVGHFPVELYQCAIDEMVKMQAFSLEHKDRSCYAFRLAFTEGVFFWEFDHFVEYCVEKEFRLPLSRGEKSSMLDLFRAASQTLAKHSRVFTHRDFHSRNLMVLSDRCIGVLDFQDAVTGPVFYDLASLLRDAYVEVPEEMEDKLLAYYSESAVSYLTGAEMEDFQYLFELSALQRDLKAAGRFCYIKLKKHNPAFMVHVPPALRKAVRAARCLEKMSSEWKIILEVVEKLLASM